MVLAHRTGGGGDKHTGNASLVIRVEARRPRGWEAVGLHLKHSSGSRWAGRCWRQSSKEVESRSLVLMR